MSSTKYEKNRIEKYFWTYDNCYFVIIMIEYQKYFSSLK